MREIILKILNEYVDEKKTDAYTSTFKERIYKLLKDNVEGKLNIEKDLLKFDIATGQFAGGWVDNPCIIIMEKRLFHGLSHIFYIQIIFDLKLNGVYIALTVHPAEFIQKERKGNGYKEWNIIKNKLQSDLVGYLDDFETQVIDHKSMKKSFYKIFEAEVICYKFYSKDNLPSNDEIIKDINSLIAIEKEIPKFI